MAGSVNKLGDTKVRSVSSLEPENTKVSKKILKGTFLGGLLDKGTPQQLQLVEALGFF